MATVTIGCKLINGLLLRHPKTGEEVLINGFNKSSIIGADHYTTEIDQSFWDAWLDANKTFQPFVAGSIYVAKNKNEAEAIAKDTKSRKTGFEAAKAEDSGVENA